VQSPALAQGPQLASSSAQPPSGAGSDVVDGAVGADVEGTAGDGVATGDAVGDGADVEGTAGDGVATGGAAGAEVEGSDVGGTCPPSTAQVQRP